MTHILYRKDLPHNSGDDLAGIIHSVGKDVYEFQPGDRVAALHMTGEENGSFAEYAVAPDWTTFHVPHHVSLEEAATMPVAALTAASALFVDLGLPAPYDPRKRIISAGEKRTPILIYGVTTSVGAFAAKFARLSGLGPLIGVAGRAANYARTLVDHVVDYRIGEDAIVAAVEAILKNEGLGTKVPYVLDAISEDVSLEVTLRLVDPNGGTVSTVLPTILFARNKEEFKFPPGVKATNTILPLVQSTYKDFGYVWSRYLGRLLEDGRLKGHPFEVVPGGLNGILTALKQLKDGRASAMKYVCRIEDTKDIPATRSDGQSLKSQGRKNTHPLRNFPFPATD